MDADRLRERIADLDPDELVRVTCLVWKARGYKTATRSRGDRRYVLYQDADRDPDARGFDGIVRVVTGDAPTESSLAEFRELRDNVGADRGIVLDPTGATAAAVGELDVLDAGDLAEDVAAHGLAGEILFSVDVPGDDEGSDGGDRSPDPGSTADERPDEDEGRPGDHGSAAGEPRGEGDADPAGRSAGGGPDPETAADRGERAPDPDPAVDHPGDAVDGRDGAVGGRDRRRDPPRETADGRRDGDRPARQRDERVRASRTREPGEPGGRDRRPGGEDGMGGPAGRGRGRRRHPEDGGGNASKAMLAVIAGLVVLGVVALVLVQTGGAGGGPLQQTKSEETGQQSTQVVDRLEPVSKRGTVTDDGRVGTVVVVLEQAPGAGEVNLSAATAALVQDDGSTEFSLTDPAVVSFVEKRDDDDSIAIGSDAARSRVVLDDPDDRVALRIDLTASPDAGTLSPGESATLRIESESGTTTTVQLAVPSSLSGSESVGL